ncbi:hypothetical protein [Thalassotalea euphylliae]|uniref:hypothetical protein n=1 Tax=Thalassotalea euphylliae TaxID=1655234 RepID=UPI0011C0761A|nr:hypothetical protein [Thalassotalea euphylliae]
MADELNVVHLNVSKHILNDMPCYKHLLKDVVHPTVEGAMYYASKIADYFNSNDVYSLVNPTHCFIDNLIEVSKSVTVRPIIELLPEYSKNIKFGRGNHELQYMPLEQGESVTIGAINDCSYLCGFTYLKGPDTSNINIISAEGRQTINGFDESCYYTRCSGAILNVYASSLTIESSGNRDSVMLLKGDCKNEDFKCYLGLAFFAKQNTVTMIDNLIERLTVIFGENIDR